MQVHIGDLLMLQCQSNPEACLDVQAHFTAPSSARRKLMSAPLNTDLKNKYGVRQITFIRYCSCYK